MAATNTFTTPGQFAPPPDRVRIVSTPGVCGGRPRIDGHRITVEDVAIWHQRMGRSADEIVSAHPSITLSDVHAALAYYYEHRERIDQAIVEGQEYAEQVRAQSQSLLQQKFSGSSNPRKWQTMSNSFESRAAPP